MTRTEIEALVLTAAAEGKLTMAHTDEADGDFETVAEWLEYTPTVGDMEDALERAGVSLEQEGPSIHEINRAAATQRARFASIKGA